ncbi:hypothetical protein HanRHA438_Chr09g0382431 [Helianthus annuus]|nr:hypothetical protein HanHA89_Chr09g0324971 [Helianthus annuus]KAJ0706212.1 hypothetical protein HanLR1_Chr09g0304481 [Helianthus annuus]KAJ0710301.1 hypothetical protein HanOQP8_Chr09g0310831 [Helianthus annuus]KAJ0886696.1 hypothetical protein HanRHA438_Chr09g0382431 [Helianthus annuus]KAJ0891704.1 hypothetical protein HanPSC8_Chr09g0357181 [Helianthus annuus]
MLRRTSGRSTFRDSKACLVVIVAGFSYDFGYSLFFGGYGEKVVICGARGARAVSVVPRGAGR